jgi:hypothetical protein
MLALWRILTPLRVMQPCRSLLSTIAQAHSCIFRNAELMYMGWLPGLIYSLLGC